MSQSLAQLYVHVTFSTKNRAPSLVADVRPHLFGYLAGVMKNINCPAIEIGGVADHLHILCRQAKNITAEDLIKKIKTPTSQWMKKQGIGFRDFFWQGGYGIFSVSPSNLSSVRQYILAQEEHHRKETFLDEFRRFLERYEVEYDERYVWD